MRIARLFRRRLWLRPVLAAFCVLTLSACDGGSGEPGDPDATDATDTALPDPSTAEPAPAEPIEVASLQACALDSDCEAGRYCFQGTCAYACTEDSMCDAGRTCSARGRCTTEPVSGGLVREDGGPQDVILDVEVQQVSDTVLYARSGDATVSFTMTLSGVPPETGLAYRVEREDDPASGEQVLTAHSETPQVTFELPVGAASPDAEAPETVRIDLVTAVGSYTLALTPEPAAGGTYAGTVALDTFGSTGLPFEASVVTEPADATLTTATRAWLVLPVDEAALFSPARGTDMPTEIAAELVYDEFVDRWVATFAHPFDLSDGLTIAAPDASQVERAMRFELEAGENGNLFGSMRDTWRGLYESRSMDGVISLADVSYEGTFELERVADGPLLADIDTEPSLPLAVPRPLPDPLVDACTTVDLSAVIPLDVDGQTWDCGAWTGIDDFLVGTPAEQAHCAVALTQTALAGETTSSQIESYLNGGSVNGDSFADFMIKCAEGTGGICVPSNAVACARQVTALAYRNQDGTSTAVGALLSSYLDATHEAFLGPQFGALQTDIETRLAWLKSTRFPTAIASEVRSYTEGLMADWKAAVLDNQFEVLAGQFDASGLVALAREPVGADAQQARAALLMEMSQSFGTAIDALTVATRRWDAIYNDATPRQQKADFVTSRARELYLAAGVLRNLNQSAGTGFLSASLGSGFGSLQRELQRLSLPFDALIYARDAEVVVSTSVDPTVSNVTLLGELEGKATMATQRALATVDEVVAEAQAQALSEAQLRNELNNEIDTLRAELVELCGLPAGCTVDEVFEDPACAVPVEAGQCGFLYDRGGEFAGFEVGSVSPSSAGAILGSVLQAAQETKIAEADLDELETRTWLLHQNTRQFAGNVVHWNAVRLEQLSELRVALAELQASSDDELAALGQALAERIEARETYIQGNSDTIAEWEQMRIGDQNEVFATLIAANTARELGAGLENAADKAEDIGEAIKEGFPTSAMDVTSAARFATKMASSAATASLLAASTASNFIGAGLELAAERHAAMQEIELDTLMLEADNADLEFTTQMTELRDAAALISAEAAAERAAIENALRLAQAEAEARLAFGRDLQELEDRRVALVSEIQKMAGLNLRVQQARMGYQSRLLDYFAEVQRAQLVDARLQELVRQREHINLIVGSPTAVFSRANRITRAEERLEDAKAAMMEWLVALEYYAVRPFMDQRIKILLARNPDQLERIAVELTELQAACGGATNELTAELSLRTDLLDITTPYADPVTGTVSSPAQRLRELMSAGYVPIDKRVRYTRDSSVGDLLSNERSVLAASFDIDLDDFANLAATCNAKVVALEVQLVGELGTGRPTVSVLYDGTSTLHSCQPGLDAYVAQFGPGTTSFGSRTRLRAAGRSVSPVAGINEFTGDVNSSLGGLPLASQYTVLIDTALGENADVDWSKLEDVRLRVTYSYQDIFPTGQCE